MSLPGYDSWLEKPYRDQDAAAARFERHLEMCERCAALERDRHGEECDGCGDPWHAGMCGIDDCECPAGTLFNDNKIEDLQNRCADDAEAAAYADYCDRLCDEARDRELEDL